MWGREGGAVGIRVKEDEVFDGAVLHHQHLHATPVTLELRISPLPPRFPVQPCGRNPNRQRRAWLRVLGLVVGRVRYRVDAELALALLHLGALRLEVRHQRLPYLAHIHWLPLPVPHPRSPTRVSARARGGVGAGGVWQGRRRSLCAHKEGSKALQRREVHGMRSRRLTSTPSMPERK